MKNVAIIASGGSGKRFNKSLPKQYHLVNHKELIVYTLETFQDCQRIDEIIIAAQSEFFKLLESIKKKYHFTKITQIVEGGKERQDSVYNALKSFEAGDDDRVIIHDAARPFLTSKILNDALNATYSFDNIVVCTKLKDTIVQGNDFVVSYLNREGIYNVQTPQIFRYDVILSSMKKAYEDEFIGTDESMLVNRAGYKVKIVEGSALNFKITTPEDLELFKKLVSGE